MAELDCKLLLLIASRRRWSDNVYPLTTIEELSQTIGARFKRTSKALHGLASIGVVTVEKRKRNLRITLCFVPFQATVTKDERRDVHLEVPRRTVLDDEPGQTGQQTGRREGQEGRRESSVDESVPDWAVADPAGESGVVFS
jgi:hypothetical protein